MQALVETAPAVALLLTVGTSCADGPWDCFGLQSANKFSVNLVDTLESPTTYAPPDVQRLALISSVYASGLPSCSSFDGVTNGIVLDLDNAQMISQATGHFECSVVRGEASLPTGDALKWLYSDGRLGDHVFTGGTALYAVIGRGAVAGCAGSWILDFEMRELAAANAMTDTDFQTGFTADQLFLTGSPGGEAPVMIGRLFQLDDGASCPALPTGVTRCVDIFLGHFQATAP